jgi:hypothetical protein
MDFAAFHPMGQRGETSQPKDGPTWETCQPKDGPPWESTAHVAKMKQEHMDQFLKDATKQMNADEAKRKAGRDEKGRFITGGLGGPGNPHGRKTAAVRAALLDAVSEKEICEIAQIMCARARQGDVAAAKFIFSYIVGKPVHVVDPDRLDLEEYNLYRQRPVDPEELNAIVGGTPVSLGVDMVRMAGTINEAKMRGSIGRMVSGKTTHMEESRLEGLEEEARLEREEALERGCLSVEEMYMYEARDRAEAEAKAAEAKAAEAKAAEAKAAEAKAAEAVKAALAEAQKQEAWKQAKAKSRTAAKKDRLPRAHVPTNDQAGSPEVESEFDAVTKRIFNGLRDVKLGQWMTNGTGPFKP